MKSKSTIHIHFQKYTWQEEGKFVVFSWKCEDSESIAYVSSQEVEIEIPENYDPRAQQIAVLQKQKQKVMADFQKSVDDINERISKLQALEYTA
jgi:DNA-directed RNA polymerase beta' subunit